MIMEDVFGRIFRISDWGDTHGPAMEGRVEGCPAGIFMDRDFVQSELARRAPDSSALSTRRGENDQVEFLAGLDEQGFTTGADILFRIANRDVKVSAQRDVIRPSHASYTYFKKYGYTDNELCGRASARQTVCRVVAGAIAKLVLRRYGAEVTSEVVSMAAPARAPWCAAISGTCPPDWESPSMTSSPPASPMPCSPSTPPKASR